MGFSSGHILQQTFQHRSLKESAGCTGAMISCLRIPGSQPAIIIIWLRPFAGDESSGPKRCGGIFSEATRWPARWALRRLASKTRDRSKNIAGEVWLGFSRAAPHGHRSACGFAEKFGAGYRCCSTMIHPIRAKRLPTGFAVSAAASTNSPNL
jgi:hypothetical protein